jgi:hypothetical protein
MLPDAANYTKSPRRVSSAAVLKNRGGFFHRRECGKLYYKNRQARL